MSRDRKYSIQLVVEGNEEEYFFKIVEAKGLSGKISLSVKNAGGFGNIASYYQSYISNDEIDAVFAVYDVDYRQNEEDSPFRTVRKQLLEILGYENSVNAASLCTNPNILQLFLLAKDTLDKVALKQTSKKYNTKFVRKYWPEIGKEKTNCNGLDNTNYYDAKIWQLELIKDDLLNSSYQNLLNNLECLPTEYICNNPGGNLKPFLIALKDGDIEFFKNLSKKIRTFDE